MPKYDFQCVKCKTVIEITRSIKDETIPKCCEPGCDGQPDMEQLISATNFALKGLGWAAEGYSKTGID